jgi:hypothetical protein
LDDNFAGSNVGKGSGYYAKLSSGMSGSTLRSKKGTIP